MASAGKVTAVTVTVEIATEVTPRLVQAFARLIPQLSKSSPPPNEAELAEMVAAGSTDVLVASDGDDVLGAATCRDCLAHNHLFDRVDQY